MTDLRTDAQLDVLLRRLDVEAEPEASFVTEGLVRLLPAVRRSRARDRGLRGRVWRDLRALDVRGGTGAMPRSLVFVAAFLVLALIAALVVYIGSQRRLPPPFGLAANGTIAYVTDKHVYLADASGANQRQLTYEEGGQVDPTFSRDGTRLAWREYPPGPLTEAVGEDIVLANADGSNAIVIARSVMGGSHPAWSPDGQFVAFSGSIEGSPNSGWIARSDGSSPPTAFTTVAGAWDPTWSPDGRRLAIGTDPGGLLVMDRDGSHVHKVTQDAYGEVGERGEIAEWSPDGTQLLFTAIKGEVSDAAEYAQEVYVVRLDGSRERMISVGAPRARDAVWSPDGSQIAYMRQSGTGLGPEVVLAEASGQVLHVLPGYYGYYQPIWSPDGSKIVVTDDRPGSDNLEGPAVRVILDVAGTAPPVVIPAAGTIRDDPPDWAASWQRLAIP